MHLPLWGRLFRVTAVLYTPSASGAYRMLPYGMGSFLRENFRFRLSKQVTVSPEKIFVRGCNYNSRVIDIYMHLPAGGGYSELPQFYIHPQHREHIECSPYGMGSFLRENFRFRLSKQVTVSPEKIFIRRCHYNSRVIAVYMHLHAKKASGNGSLFYYHIYQLPNLKISFLLISSAGRAPGVGQYALTL